MYVYSALLLRGDAPPHGRRRAELAAKYIPLGIGSQRAGVLLLTRRTRTNCGSFCPPEQRWRQGIPAPRMGGSWENQTTALLDSPPRPGDLLPGRYRREQSTWERHAIFYRDNSTGVAGNSTTKGCPANPVEHLPTYYREGKLVDGYLQPRRPGGSFAVSFLPLAQPTVDKLSSGCLR